MPDTTQIAGYGTLSAKEHAGNGLQPSLCSRSTTLLTLIPYRRRRFCRRRATPAFGELTTPESNASIGAITI